MNLPKRPSSKAEKTAFPLITENLAAAYPHVTSALLLVARNISEPLGLATPSVTQVIEATGASRSSAYALIPALTELLPTLARPKGRPPKPPTPLDTPALSAGAALTRAVLAYVMGHPGCVHRDRKRQQYSDGFRHFILEQQRVHPSLDVEAFAEAALVPLGTLKDWLRVSVSPPSETRPEASTTEDESVPEDASSKALDTSHMGTVLDAWTRWEGSFIDFCAHVKSHLHVPYGKAIISTILQANGARQPQRRSGTYRPDAIATRGSFQTFFPGAQWVADGMSLPVIVDGKTMHVNLELNVDTDTGAFVGVSVRDTEDASAAIEVFQHGVEQTGSPPIAQLFDNKPSNHTPEVDAALGDTLRMRATVERPENKAHVEGAFGLFSRALPALMITTTEGPQALARTLALISALIWTRVMNHRPRADRDNRSRAELYRDKPSAEKVEEARKQLKDIIRQHELARLTLEARRRPEILTLLDEHFARLALLDPERHIRIAIAGYGLDDILAGLAIFDGKKNAATLPEGADARYLLGIVRNVAAKREGEHVARALFDLRVAADDSFLLSLIALRDTVCAPQDKGAVINDCVDRALKARGSLERTFWMDALADVLRPLDREQCRERFLAAARRINATFAVGIRERQDAVRLLAERLVPAT